jgi:hypothetical protein
MPWELTGNPNTNENIDFVGTTDNHSLVIKTNGKEAFRVDTARNIGIGGSTDPTSKLQIHAQDGMQILGPQPFLTLADANAGYAKGRLQNANGTFIFYTQSGLDAKNPTVLFNTLVAQPGGQLPSAIEIHAQDGMQIVGYQPFLTLADANAGYAKARLQNANGDVFFYTESGISSGIPAMVIKNGSGDATMSGNLTVSGDVFLPGADCAEQFDSAEAEQIEPGTVVVIDQEGAVRQSQEAYDKRVAGVVSGAGGYRTGIVLDKQQAQASRAPVALVGKVYCKVDAQYSPVEVGDLLTSSLTPGYAMKADNPLRAFGAVIGKALRPLRAGQGLIPILIALE